MELTLARSFKSLEGGCHGGQTISRSELEGREARREEVAEGGINSLPLHLREDCKSKSRPRPIFYLTCGKCILDRANAKEVW